MLKLKVILTLVLFAFLFSSISFAQKLPGDRAGYKADYLYKKLSLTNDQYAQVYKLFLAHEIKCIEDAKTKSTKKCSEECKKEHEAINAEISKILTKEQLPKFEAIKDKWDKKVYKKKVRKIKKTEGTENKEEKKEVKKEDKKDDKKDKK